jgi:N-acetylglucosamine-6-phosphate deacetylase
MIYLEGGSLLYPEGRLEEAAVVIHAGRIQAVGLRSQIPPPEEATRLSTEGLLLSPGWIDLQLNGGFGFDFTAQPESIWQVGARLPEHGVTAFLPTIITSPPAVVQAALQALHDGPPPGYRGALPLGLHVEGPFLNPQKRGAHNPDYLRPPDLELARGWCPHSGAHSGVRLVTLAPELPGALEVIHFLAQQGITASAGHSQASWEQAQAGFDAGITCGTHLFNTMPPLDHRAPGLAAALLTDPRVRFGIIVDGIHVHPGAAALAWQAAANRLFLVTDAMTALGMPAGEYSLGELQVIVDDTSARLPDGRLAGSILRMDQAVHNLVQFTGCALEKACAAASSTPAQVIGEQARGRIAPGMRADLTLLSADFQVAATMVGGEIVFQKDDLWE